MDTRTLNKLKKAAPLMERYTENERIINQTEHNYVFLACHDLPGRDVELPKKPDEKKHKTVSTVCNLALPIAVIFIVIGFIRLATTSGDFGGMGAAFGIFLAIGSYFFAKHESKKFSEEMAKYEAIREKVDKNNAAKEAAVQKYHEDVERAKAENTELLSELTAMNLPLHSGSYKDIGMIICYLESGMASDVVEACRMCREDNAEFAAANKLANDNYWFRFWKCNSCKKHNRCKLEKTEEVSSCTSYVPAPKD